MNGSDILVKRNPEGKGSKAMRGIAFFGLNGGGKSTLAHALARRIGCYEMDMEDYYFPEQRQSRRRALENGDRIDAENPGGLPFSAPRSREEVQAALIRDAQAHPDFVLSGVTPNWDDRLLARIDIAFWVQTPLAERLKRIQAREEKRFGARVREGGDMFSQQQAILKMVEGRDLQSVSEWAEKLGCPVIDVDGTLPVAENLERMMGYLKEMDRRD